MDLEFHGAYFLFYEGVEERGRWTRSGIIDLVGNGGLGMWDKGHSVCSLKVLEVVCRVMSVNVEEWERMTKHLIKMKKFRLTS